VPIAEVELVAVERSFGGHRVLDRCDFIGRAGEAWVLRGPNGSGKSTLFAIVAGVLDPDAGTVLVDRRPNTEARARAEIGYAPANALLPEHLHLHEWIDLLGALRRASADEIDRAVERWDLASCTGDRVSALSLGQRRRVALAASELGRPSFMLWDEPTVGLDPAGQALVVNRLRSHVEAGGLAWVASHEPWLADAIGARNLTLERGRISRA
jgi:ABC-type multidrug transport system ATPase subunit